ncbi:MAG: hypothetical protein NDJ89_09365 [Oligoflexia bacterium]|nr:hypothetical protein [Oligoflexia bacterium]
MSKPLTALASLLMIVGLSSCKVSSHSPQGILQLADQSLKAGNAEAFTATLTGNAFDLYAGEAGFAKFKAEIGTEFALASLELVKEERNNVFLVTFVYEAKITDAKNSMRLVEITCLERTSSSQRVPSISTECRISDLK